MVESWRFVFFVIPFTFAPLLHLFRFMYTMYTHLGRKILRIFLPQVRFSHIIWTLPSINTSKTLLFLRFFLSFFDLVQTHILYSRPLSTKSTYVCPLLTTASSSSPSSPPSHDHSHHGTTIITDSHRPRLSVDGRTLITTSHITTRRWVYTGLKEPPSEFKPVVSSPYIRVFENGSLAIQRAQKSDAAFYLCQASNDIGPGLSKVLKLTVHGKSNVN